MNDWFVYILQCSDGSLYTGITNDVDRRLHEHNNTSRGAKYTKSRRPVKLKYVRIFKDRSSASKEEARIKKLSRSDKFKLFFSKET